MVKNALPHFSQKHERARKNQTPISGPTLELVRRKQTILKALAMARGTTKFLEAGQERNAMRELFRLTRKMAPPQRLSTQTVRQCCPKTGALGERCWTQDEELDARTHALEYMFDGTAGESPEITVDDPKDQISEATEIPAGPFAAVDVVRAVKGLPNYRGGPEHCSE